MLFSDWQAVTHALQPTHALMSTAMPQAWPLYSCGGYIERPGSGSCPSSWMACLFFASSASVTARTMCRSSAWWCAVASIVQWSWVQATIAVPPVLRSCRPPLPHAASLVRSA